MRFVLLALLLLGYAVPETPTAEPIYAHVTDDMLRDRAVEYWGRMWGFDAEGRRLLQSISAVENFRGIPTALGPEFCLIRAGGTSEEGSRIDSGRVPTFAPLLGPVPSKGKTSEAPRLIPGTCLRYTRAIGVMQVLPSHVSSDNARMCGAQSVAKLKQTWPNACLGVLLFRDYLFACYGNVTCALEKYGGVVTEAGRRASRYTEKVYEALE